VTSLVDLREGDATALEFGDGEFDLVYSFHALEHIPNYRGALGEMRRVLASGGCYCIGTPNRQRIVGYLGSKTATTLEKVRWNAKDWRDRLAGRFTNEAGAHAGFVAEELQSELLRHFASAEDIGPRYYAETRPSYSRILGLVAGSGLGRYVFPAVYFFGRA
jgi:ubiquinone/menaquinone biosynthesis C-methylase UbiE